MNKIVELMNNCGSPLFVFSPREFIENYLLIKNCLPQVKHHYALKSLPHEDTVRCIDEVNGYIELASIGEIELVKSVAPDLLSNALYTHPIKSEIDLKKIVSTGIQTVIADNKEELIKISRYKKKLKVLIRLAFPNKDALCNLSYKFGILPEKAVSLILFAKELGLDVQGCSFHVGSQMPSPSRHLDAIKVVYEIYRELEQKHGIYLKILNIGGGFPAKYNESDMEMELFCIPIKSCLEDLFPNTEIWAEPGRCISASSATAYCKVIGKTQKDGKFWYYLDEGVYGLFSNIIFDHFQGLPKPIESSFAQEQESVLCGPTCDSIDIISHSCKIQELEIGDILYCSNMGSYSWASKTRFNHCVEANWINIASDTDLNFHDLAVEEVLASEIKRLTEF